MSKAKTIPLEFVRHSEVQMGERAQQLQQALSSRRSVRHFSTDRVPMEVVRSAVMSAASAPSGANKQPWTFVIISDPQTKKAIREAAEAEEREFYGGRAPQTWLADLEPFGTDANKPFLEEAPILIAVFAHNLADDGSKNYYVKESVGIACGFLLATLHLAGLATLTHTPNPMKFLSEILNRPANERPFLLIPVGYPVAGCQVPDIQRKPAADVMVEK